MNESVLTNYINKHFSDKPEGELMWKYQIRDMLDEWFFVLVAAVLCYVLFTFGGIWFWFAVAGWIGCGIGVLYLIGIVMLRRLFMKFKLTRDHFEYTHGCFIQKVETFQLSDIIEVDLRRSWWERIISTGTIIIHFKNGMESRTNPLVIRGIGKYEEMFKKIDYYRNHHRLVLYFGI